LHLAGNTVVVNVKSERNKIHSVSDGEKSTLMISIGTEGAAEGSSVPEELDPEIHVDLIVENFPIADDFFSISPGLLS